MGNVTVGDVYIYACHLVDITDSISRFVNCGSTSPKEVNKLQVQILTNCSALCHYRTCKGLPTRSFVSLFSHPHLSPQSPSTPLRTGLIDCLALVGRTTLLEDLHMLLEPQKNSTGAREAWWSYVFSRPRGPGQRLRNCSNLNLFEVLLTQRMTQSYACVPHSWWPHPSLHTRGIVISRVRKRHK